MATKKKKKRKRKPSRVAAIHPLVIKSGLASNPDFARIGPDDSIDEGTRKWMESRYEETCLGCGDKRWRVKLETPVCYDCWVDLPHPPRQWWWTSKRTKKSLRKFLDAYFPDRPKVAA